MFSFELQLFQTLPTCLVAGGLAKEVRELSPCISSNRHHPFQREEHVTLHLKTRQICGTKKQVEGGSLNYYLGYQAGRCLLSCSLCDYLT